MKHIFIAIVLFAVVGVLPVFAQVDGVYTPQDWSAELSQADNRVTLHYSGPSRIKNIKAIPIHPMTVGIDDGKPLKVLFSPGNLQYHPNPPSGTPNWRFAPNQWDVCFQRDGLLDVGVHHRGIRGQWIDLFGWGMWLTEPPTSIDKIDPLTTSPDYSNDYIPSVSAGALPAATVMGGKWRNLLLDEWRFLIENEDVRADKCCLATVCGIEGVVILPDDWKSSSRDYRYPPLKIYNDSDERSWKSNVIDADTWQKMQDLGAAFLPAADTRRQNVDETNECELINYQKNDKGYSGTYWSDLGFGGCCAYCFSFSEFYFNSLDHCSRCHGKSVRLTWPLQKDNILPDDIALEPKDGSDDELTVEQDPDTRIWSFKYPAQGDYAVIVEYEDVEIDDFEPYKNPYTGSEIMPTLTVKADGLVLPTTEYTLVYPADVINVGEKAVVVTVLNNAGGNMPDAEKKYEITPQEIIVVADPKNKIYGDQDPELTYTVKGAASTDMIIGALTRAPGEDVGTYAISQGTLATTDANYAIAFQNGDFTIAPTEIILIWGTTDFVYDGSEHVPTATVSGLPDGVICNVTVSGAQVNAGTYTATATLDNPNYKPSNGITPFTIAKADPVVIPPVPVEGLVFNNKRHTLITAGYTNGGTMLYKILNGGYSETLPQAINVGEYEVYYYVEGDDNYNSTEEKFVVAVIHQSEIPVADDEKIECNASKELFCNGKATLSYLIVFGDVRRYTLTFDTPEIPSQQGDITKPEGDFEFSLPHTLRPGKYEGAVVFTDVIGKDSEVYPFEFEIVNIYGLIKRLYYNTLCADNHEQLYSSYQWTRDGSDISGETFQYLHPSNGRLSNGVYTTWADMDGGGRYESCPFEVKDAVSKKTVPAVVVYPNPATSNGRITIEIVDYDSDTDYQIVVNSNTGKLIKTISNAQQINHLSLPKGNYAGILIAGDIKYGFKIVVK